MMTLMNKSEIINLHIQGKSNVEIANILGIHRNTVGTYVRDYESLQQALQENKDDVSVVRKITEQIIAEPKYDISSRCARKWNEDMDSFLDRILFEEERKKRALGSNKQRLTKTQIHRLMLEEGFDISLSTVQIKINLKQQKQAEAYIAQQYEFGDRFEYDFGEVKLMIADKLTKLYLAVMVAPASDYRFALLYDNQKKQVFIDSQVRFFTHMGGCFNEGVYDNMRNVVKKFIGKNQKELNEDLLKLASYYGFSINVTNCFAGNEKGSVERSVEIIRSAAFASKWEFASISEAQSHLDNVLRELNKDKDLIFEKAALSLGKPPYEAADIRPDCLVDKYSCITYDHNQYSVPETLVGKKVLVKGYPNEIVVMAKDTEIARHERLSGKGGMRLEIRHYLSTFRRKPGALSNSVALKSEPELKRIFDSYYSERPREFVEILNSSNYLSMPELFDELKACATPEQNFQQEKRMGAIENQTMAQILLIPYAGKETRCVV